MRTVNQDVYDIIFGAALDMKRTSVVSEDKMAKAISEMLFASLNDWERKGELADPIVAAAYEISEIWVSLTTKDIDEVPV